MSCFWKHKWNKWEKIKDIDISKFKTSNPEIESLGYRLIIQKRICSKCNLEQQKGNKIYY